MTQSQVYFAKSLEEVRTIEACREPRGTRYWLARAFVSAWALGAHGVVSALKRCLFRWSGLRRDSVQNIVAYAVGTLGDNVVILPSLAALRQAFPDASLTVIANATGYDPESARTLYANSAWLDRVVICRDDPVKREGLRLRIDYPGQESIRCDLFVNFSRFGNSGWLGAVLRELILAKRLDAKWVIGFHVHAYNRYSLLLNRVKHHVVRNEPRRPAEVLKEIGLVPTDARSALPASAAAVESVMQKLGLEVDGRPIMVMNPGAKFKVKCWPVERFAALAQRLNREYSAWIVVTGTAVEKDLGDVILRLPGSSGTNLCGKTSVQELVELLRISTACITNDTGTMHLAAELDVPTVALFGTRISPTHWFPKGNKVVAVFAFEQDSYSYNDEGDLPSAGLMRIEVDHVLKALHVVLPAGIGDSGAPGPAL